MSYNQNYLENLLVLISLIKEGKFIGDDGAYKKFETYLEDVAIIGSFDSSNWDSTWRKRIYEFGRLFSENKKEFTNFLSIIEKFREDHNKEEREIVEFIYSEMACGFFGLWSENAINEIRKLINIYPANPEFHQTYSHYLQSKEKHTEAIDESKMAFEIEPTSRAFYSNLFNKYKSYVNYLLLKGKIEEARDVITKMQLIVKEGDYTFGNIIVSLNDRIDDHRVIKKRIHDFSTSFTKVVEKEQKRIIEILGIFVAIISFIFININIVLKNYDLGEIFLLMIGMAIVLLIFAISVSLLFSSEERVGPSSLLKSPKVYAIFILLVILALLYSRATSVSNNNLKKFNKSALPSEDAKSSSLNMSIDLPSLSTHFFKEQLSTSTVLMKK